MPELAVAETEQPGESGENDDGERAIERDNGDGCAGVFLARAACGRHGADRRDPADGESRRHQHRLVPLEPEQSADEQGNDEAHGDKNRDSEDGDPAEPRDVTEAELEPEHHDAEPQKSAAR